MRYTNRRLLYVTYSCLVHTVDRFAKEKPCCNDVLTRIHVEHLCLLAEQYTALKQKDAIFSFRVLLDSAEAQKL